jgi:hypothetical protein
VSNIFDDLFNVGNGIRSGIEDVPSLIGNVLTGDFHGVVTDGREIIGDVGDVLTGVEGLGVSLGQVPERYMGTVGKLADSWILQAAQLAIEAEKATTGSGAPEEGNGYQESAVRLEGAVESLIDANPHGDRWDGEASTAYSIANIKHREFTSRVQVADEKIAEVLSIEAGQVSRTRQTLDEASQYLYDYGLATAWMNFIPTLAMAKQAADATAAGAALASTNGAMLTLVKNSVENAQRIRQSAGLYEGAAEHTSGVDPGECGTFVEPGVDKANLPSRLQPDAKYEIPGPEEPFEHGPPTTPYQSPTSGP